MRYNTPPNQKIDDVPRVTAPPSRGRAVIAPEDAEADAGVLGEAVRARNYQAFRAALAGHEEWLRKRVGRWIQRYPDAEAKLGRGLAIGDVLEAVFLSAFEQYADRPTAVAFHEWLDDLIDPSLKALLKHPDQESENASFARTVRDTPGLS